MCWNTNIHVVLQRDTPTARATLTQPAGNSLLVLEGDYPDYWVTNGVCGCTSVIEPHGKALPDPTMAYVRHFLDLPVVKRVELHWWWGDLRNRPAAGEDRLSLAEFEARNAAGGLAPGVTYRISNLKALWGRKG